MCDGKIIDGFHRDEACYIAGREPRYIELHADANKLNFVLSKNLRRRQLTASQTGLLMARVAQMSHGGQRQGSGRAAAYSEGQKNQDLNLDLDSFPGAGEAEASATDSAQNPNNPLEHPEVSTAVSLSDAARLGGVSRATVAVAKKLINEGNDNLLNAVMQHGMSNGHALALSKLPIDDQSQAISDFVEGKQEGEGRIKRKESEKKAVAKSKKENAGIDVTCVDPGESPLLTIARVNNGLDWAINFFKVEVPNEGLQHRYDKLLARAKAFIENDQNVKKINSYTKGG